MKLNDVLISYDTTEDGSAGGAGATGAATGATGAEAYPYIDDTPEGRKNFTSQLEESVKNIGRKRGPDGKFVRATVEKVVEAEKAAAAAGTDATIAAAADDDPFAEFKADNGKYFGRYDTVKDALASLKQVDSFAGNLKQEVAELRTLKEQFEAQGEEEGVQLDDALATNLINVICGTYDDEEDDDGETQTIQLTPSNPQLALAWLKENCPDNDEIRDFIFETWAKIDSGTAGIAYAKYLHEQDGAKTTAKEQAQQQAYLQAQNKDLTDRTLADMAADKDKYPNFEIYMNQFVAEIESDPALAQMIQPVLFIATKEAKTRMFETLYYAVAKKATTDPGVLAEIAKKQTETQTNLEEQKAKAQAVKGIATPMPSMDTEPGGKTRQQIFDEKFEERAKAHQPILQQKK